MCHFLPVHHRGIVFWGQVEGQNITIGPYQILSLRVRVDPGAMAMKGTPHSSNLQNYWNLTIRLFNIISRTLVGVNFPLSRGAVSVFYSLSRLGKCVYVCVCVCVCVWIRFSLLLLWHINYFLKTFWETFLHKERFPWQWPKVETSW